MRDRSVVGPRSLVVAALVAAIGAIVPVSASAANQDVGVFDDFFAPSRVAVKPDESVTWTKDLTGEEHNIKFEDESGARVAPSKDGWTVNRSFSAAGAYPFYCEIHGGPGGAGMSGVVYVNATGEVPTPARFTVSPGVARVGETVTFSSDSGPAVTKYEWDLDGNGSFEKDTGAIPTVSHVYTSPATLSVKLKATDSKGSDVATRSLKINAAPTASFAASPSPAQAGQTVSFDAGGSSDSDGTIVKYEWDLDGDGSFETVSVSLATASRSYPGPAALTIKLRVTDSDGASTETTRSLQIDAAPAPPSPPALVPPQQQASPQPQISTKPQSTSKPKPTAKPKRKPGKCSKLKGNKRAACIKKACRKLTGSKKRSCVKKVTA